MVGATRRAKSRIFIVDDHPLVRCGYTYLIQRHQDLEICGEAESVDEALEGIAGARPDLVITDLSLAGASGMELITSMQAWRPSVPILVISMHDEDQYAWRAIRAGSRGYITKSKGDAAIVHAIKLVLNGGFYLSERMTEAAFRDVRARRMSTFVDPVTNLSERELEIFRLCGQGLTFREISDSLDISNKTVSTHRMRIRTKLNISSNTALIRQAVHWVESE